MCHCVTAFCSIQSAILIQVPLLASLQPLQLSQLCAKMGAEHHDAGAAIFHSVRCWIFDHH